MMNFEQIISKLGANSQEFQLQFQSHPNYPSALAFSDTLNFMGIQNDAYQLEKEYWVELPDEFITIYNDKFALIKKEKEGFKIFSDEIKTISKEDLNKNTTDFVLLFEKIKENLDNSNFNFSYFLYPVFTIIFLYSAFFQNWQSALFNLFSIVGIYISLELFRKKFGKESAVILGICGDARSNSKKTDCNTIIKNDKINVLGLKLADLSLVYFLGVLAIGLFLPVTAGILKLLSCASVLVIFYSFFIQIFIEKALCKVCLLIISLLAGQILISSLFFGNEISTKLFFILLFDFVVVFFGLAFINDLTQQKENYRKSDIKNLKFKRNYEVFKRELITKDKINFENNKNGFFLGNPDAKLHISLVSNPYCSFCKNAHEILEKLLKNYPNQISSQIRFNLSSEKQNEKLTQLISSLKNIYEIKGKTEFLESLRFWFENKDEKQPNKKDSSWRYTNLEEFEKIGKENFTHGLNFTPTFLINGYHFPDKYEREDIFYFIDELLEDEDILK